MTDFSTALTELSQRLGYAFSKDARIEEALTHKSFSARGGRGYERLEFLGDRVLGLIMAETLLEHFAQEAEGAIAKRHASLVSRESLVVIAEQLDLASFIQMPRSERLAGAANQASVQADAMEAVLGAIYLDGGLDAARSVIHRFWHPLLHSAGRPPVDAKSALQEWAQGRGKPLPSYTLEGRSGAAHTPLFTVRVDVQGLPPFSAAAGSKKVAEQAAAQRALTYLHEQENPAS